MITIQEINDLSAEERMTLMEMIWRSFDEEELEKLPLSTEQQQEIERRLDAYQHGKTKTHTWEEVKQIVNLR